MFTDLSAASAARQTSEWNHLLRKSCEEGRGNVIASQRSQLMTRDLCMTTFSLFILTTLAVLVLAIWKNSLCLAIKTLGLPLAYLLVMIPVTQKAAGNRAKRLVALVIKTAVQDYENSLRESIHQDFPNGLPASQPVTPAR